MSGPCAIESRKQLLDTAHAIKKAGAHILRGVLISQELHPMHSKDLRKKDYFI